MRNFMLFLAMLLAFVIGYWSRSFFVHFRQRVCQIEEPLELVTDNPSADYQLPPGTVLYYDHSPKSESFDVYRVYINVSGKPLDLKPIRRYGLISPLVAFNDDFGDKLDPEIDKEVQE